MRVSSQPADNFKPLDAGCPIVPKCPHQRTMEPLSGTHCSFLVCGVSLQGPRGMRVGVGGTPPVAQSAAAGRSAGIHPKPSVQRQPEDRSAGRVGAPWCMWLRCTRGSHPQCGSSYSIQHVSGTPPLVQCNREGCRHTGAKRGQTRAALWVLTAMRGTLRAWTATPWSAGRSSCISWWALRVLLSVRIWLSCWSKQAS